MGGDLGPAAVIPAAAHMTGNHPGLEIILVGDQARIKQALDKLPSTYPRIAICHASEEVAMDEGPAQALRTKKDSSMRVAIDLVKRGEAGACVSSGNTGALMATAKFVLKTQPGLKRPAICAALPGIKGHTHVLDLGANVDSSPAELRQFAVMGSVLASAVENKPNPTVALLNIGAEAIKGNERVKRTAELVEASDLNYVGFVEGDDLYKGEVDVIVCDGFVGNVALKASEGVVHMVTHFARQEFSRNLLTRIRALIAAPALRALHDRTDPRRYNGASLLGLNGIVVKSHGGADDVSFANAIRVAMLEVEKAVPEHIGEHMGHWLRADAAV